MNVGGLTANMHLFFPSLQGGFFYRAMPANGNEDLGEDIAIDPPARQGENGDAQVEEDIAPPPPPDFGDESDGKKTRSASLHFRQIAEKQFLHHGI